MAARQPSTEAHRKRVKHYEEAICLHELTFSCYRRKPLLTNDCWRGIFCQALQQATQEERFQLVAFVLMVTSGKCLGLVEVLAEFCPDADWQSKISTCRE